MKTLYTTLLSLLLVHATAFAQSSPSEIVVKITPTLPTAEVNHRGTPITVKRIQDTSNKLVDDFAKTSRPCLPFCISPMGSASGVVTIGEIDLLDFLGKEVAQGGGLLIDARMPRFFKSETIPGSINIPFILFTSAVADILPLLGALADADAGGQWDFSDAKELLLWCNGPWCDESPRAIKALVKEGYPPEKLRYYRGGMQLWKMFGLTTIQPLSNEVSSS
ncbi:MAG: rhodanese-like domain-containing protein [Desulfobacterales bacterium]|nr:rhodanese-like domain-containing protein [Desulfobacterales bacterium]